MRSEGETELFKRRFSSKCWQCGSTGLECRIHNPKVVGSSPTAAIFKVRFQADLFFGLSIFPVSDLYGFSCFAQTVEDGRMPDRYRNGIRSKK